MLMTRRRRHAFQNGHILTIARPGINQCRDSSALIIVNTDDEGLPIGTEPVHVDLLLRQRFRIHLTPF